MIESKKSFFVQLYLGSISISGLLLVFLFLDYPSEPGNRLWFGFSLTRLAVAAIFFLLLMISFTATAFSIFHTPAWLGSVVHILGGVFSRKNGLYSVFTGLYLLGLISTAMLFLTLLPVVEHMEVYIGMVKRLAPLLIWLLFSVVLLILLLCDIYRRNLQREVFFSPLKRIAWVLIFLGIYMLVVMYCRETFYLLSLKHFEPPLLWLGAFLLISVLVSEFASKKSYQATLSRFLFLIGIFLTALVLYGHIATWDNWIHKGRYEYWDTLAGQFVQGKLYFPEPPVPTLSHDLTLYNGKWYVPNPPLPAVLLTPLLVFMKPEDIYMGDVSIFFSAVNILLVYLILEQFMMRKWIKLSRGDILWLTVLFAFGTNHLWVGINGGVWFTSQVFTVTFSALAILASLKGWSPWVVGLSLGLALMARPNSIMTWPLVFAIAMQIIHEEAGTFDFRQMVMWSIRSGLPILVGVAGLLLYNYARFDNYFDFGYTTINGDPTIVKNAQTYGIFSLRYVLHNLQVMFLFMPKVEWGSPWLLSPAKAGMSVFLSTPPLIYLIRRYEHNWWILGAWAAMFFNFMLLMLYHNTGSDQFGYRYILDLILPVMVLLAWSFKEKIPWHFYVLLLLSVMMNLYGAAWFVNGPS